MRLLSPARGFISATKHEPPIWKGDSGILYTQAGSAAAVASTNVPIPAHVAGDILIAVVCMNPDTNGAIPSGWNLLWRSTPGWMAVLWRRSTGDAIGNFVFTSSSGTGNGSFPARATALVACIGGCVAGDPFVDPQSTYTASSVSSLTAPDVVSAADNSLILIAEGHSSTSSPNPHASSWTNANLLDLAERADSPGDNQLHMAVATGVKENAGATGTTAIALSASTNAFNVAFKVALSPG